MRIESHKIDGFTESAVEPRIGQDKADSAIWRLTSAQVRGVLLADSAQAGILNRIASEIAEPQQASHELLSAVPLPAETGFYNQYRWCLDACPVLGEVLNHLSEELAKLDQSQGGWQESEVITNIFLLSCSITDTLDDYLLGNTYDFSKLEQALPFAKAGVHALERCLRITGHLREKQLSFLRRWKEAWKVAVTKFLQHCFVAGAPDRATLIEQRNQFAPLLQSELPESVIGRRAKIPAFFRSRDFAPHDCLELGRKLVAVLPGDTRPVMVLGLRTAGSFLAPLLSAFLSRQSFDVDWIAVRPSKGLTAQENRELRQAAHKKARIVIVDESIHSGQTLAQTIVLLRHSGFADEDVLVLNPAEPAFPEWRDSRILQALPKINTIALEPAERFKHRLLESGAVEAYLAAYFQARGYQEVRVQAGVGAKADSELQKPPERVDVRLKRVYEVCLKNSDGNCETRYVLAKSVGWGWLSYHAFLAAQSLQGFVPPMLGLRNGILYAEWIPEAKDATEVMTQNRDEVTELLACYVAARARNLRLSGDPTPDLARESRHKGFEMLSNALSRAYNSRVVAAFERRHIQRELSNQGCPVSVMTDSKMSPDEWIVAGTKLLKTDFEHHAQGKNELGMTDPAYDLAGAIFHFGLSERESARLVKTYGEDSGDANVADRLFLNKLLVGLWEQNLATLGLQTGKLLHRRNEFHQQYTTAWNFLVMEAIQQCGKLCLRPTEICWKTPLVVTDIDGVLDRMVFGFPCATAAGIKAISLLHSHDFGIAINTARSLQEVKQYCSSYGFAGGVAEYGAVIWDAVNHREAVLASSHSLAQMERVKKALQEIPGVFLNDDYQYSLRAVTYHNGRTTPLPPVLVQDLLGKLGVDHLRAHHTGLDTAIVAKATDKGAGLLHLLKLIGLPADETMAIGDSEPDLAMFRVVHSSFAPGHISCRREARLLRCRIASRPYQPGLLQIARQISHPHGGTCDHCQSVEAAWPKDKNLFLSLLNAADETPLRSLRRALTSSPLALFRK